MIQFNTEQPVAVNLAATQEIISQIRADAMGGWFELPERYERGEMQTELASIKSAAAKIQSDSKFLVCIGIGGSYLGHRALIEALGSLPETEAKTKILYAGNSLSPLAFDKLLKTLGDADFSINVISKSGTTTEPAVAFRFLKEKLIQKYGTDGARARIYATTDANRGALHDEALQENTPASSSRTTLAVATRFLVQSVFCLSLSLVSTLTTCSPVPLWNITTLLITNSRTPPR